jgi:hypothetical protein
LPRTTIREIDKKEEKEEFLYKKKRRDRSTQKEKLINKGKESGKRTHSNANTRINE